MARRLALIFRVGQYTQLMDNGLILPGLLNYLGKHKTAGTLAELAGVDGIVNCVFICCDLPYQYIDEYFDKVESTAFHPIHNEVSPV